MGQRKVASRSAQWPLLAEFVFNWDDTMVDSTGATKDFKTVGTIAFDIIPLPPGAIVQGGEVVTETAIGGGGTYTLQIGDSGLPPAAAVPNRYMTAGIAVTAAGRLATSIVPSGYVNQGENIRMTLVIGGAAATAGKVSVKVWYVIRDRANEVNPT